MRTFYKISLAACLIGILGLAGCAHSKTNHCPVAVIKVTRTSG